MIEIKVDKASEFYWIKNVIDSGVMNLSNPYSLIYLGVKLNQKVTYKLSDNYEDDIKEKVEEYKKRLAKFGRSSDLENILKKELFEKGKGKNESDK